MASLAGAWMALVAGFGGMRAGMGPLAFSPRLPDGISALTFRMRYRGRKLRVTIKEGRAKYELMEGDPLAVTHHGDEFELGKRNVERKIRRRRPGRGRSSPLAVPRITVARAPDPLEDFLVRDRTRPTSRPCRPGWYVARSA